MQIIIPLPVRLLLLSLVFLSGHSLSAQQDTIYHYALCFPPDVSALCPDDPEIPGVTYEEYGCDLLAVSTEDVFLPFTSDSVCYKIFRTYRVLNWCEYDGEAIPTVVGRDWDGWNGTNPGRCWQPRPDGNDEPGDRGICVIVERNISDEIPDTVWYDADMDPTNDFPDNPDTDTTEHYWWRVISGDWDEQREAYYEGNCSTWAFDGNQTDSDIRGNIARDDDDRRYGSFGFWEYTQHISVFNDTPPDLQITVADSFCTRSGACAAQINASIQVVSTCTSADNITLKALLFTEDDTPGTDITRRLQGEWPLLSYTTTLPLGTYRLVVTADDGCGPRAVKSASFSVVDCVGPSPICINRLSVGLMPDDEGDGASMAVWASDFIASAIYDCSGQDPTQTDREGRALVNTYSINRVGAPVDSTQQGVVFTCADTSEVQLLQVHAWDTRGNHSFCAVEVVVQDNRAHCPPPVEEIQLPGQIRTVDGIPVPGVDVYVQMGPDDAPQILEPTGEEGGFLLRTAGFPASAVITAQKEDEPFAGLGLRDALWMVHHILGTQPLRTPQQLLAADLNQSGSITVLDLVYLRKALLGLYTDWPDGKPWLFMDARFRFARPLNPWQEYFPQSVAVATLQPTDTIRITAIKMGDVDESALKPSASPVLRSNTTRAVPLFYQDQYLSRGQTATIRLTIPASYRVAAGRFELHWQPDGAQVRFTEEAAGHVLFPVSDASCKVLFLQEQPSGDQTWTVEVTAREDVWLHELWELSAKTVPAEVLPAGADAPVPLVLTPQRTQAGLELQLLENPVHTALQVRWTMPRAETATLRVVNAAGQVLMNRTLPCMAGAQHLAIQEGVQAWPSGVYWLHLSAAEYTEQVPFVIRRE